MVAARTGSTLPPVGFSSSSTACNRVRAALTVLPPRDRDVLVLRYLEDLSTAETAAVLDVGVSVVKMRLLRALQKLRVILDEEDLS